MVTMKKQTGIWVDAAVWSAYRQLCSREKLRPAEPIEKFLGFVLKGGSALAVLKMLDTMGKSEGLEAYARVLLEWYRSGKKWIDVTDEEEPMLLQALRNVTDPKLRREIEAALTTTTGKTKAPPGIDAMQEKIAELKKLVKGK
ncbi:MAG: hypothetical protein ACQXXG_08905 [Candidatus Bathyarchaeia archaeon]|jgi:hypothetical protein